MCWQMCLWTYTVVFRHGSVGFVDILIVGAVSVSVVIRCGKTTWLLVLSPCGVAIRRCVTMRFATYGITFRRCMAIRFGDVWRYGAAKYAFRAFEQSYYARKSLCLVAFHVEQSFHI